MEKTTKFCSEVNSIFEQINPFKCLSSVCECVCVYVCVCVCMCLCVYVCVCVCVNYVNY